MSTDIRQTIQQATTAFEAGDYGGAEALLLQVVDRAPPYANLYNMLGFIASQHSEMEKAVALFRQALSLNPNYTEAQLNLALTLTEMGAYEEAAREVAKLEGRGSGDSHRLSVGVLGKLANAHADLGKKYHELGMYAQAVGEYDKALHLCPNFPDIHNRRAVSCRELGDYAEAKVSLLRALELNPRYAEAYVNLGVLHQRQGELTDAVRTWERALELDPKHRLARTYLRQAKASGTVVN